MHKSPPNRRQPARNPDFGGEYAVYMMAPAQLWAGNSFVNDAGKKA
jgi:hypothetical protein